MDDVTNYHELRAPCCETEQQTNRGMNSQHCVITKVFKPVGSELFQSQCKSGLIQPQLLLQLQLYYYME